MTKRVAPYKHSDGSPCWTKNCSLNTLKEEPKEKFIQEWFAPEETNVEGKTFIDTIATQAEFDAAVAAGQISRQRHPLYPYSIYKYSQITTYQRNWNTITMASRGLVVNDETGEIVARPFSKFFNHNEDTAPLELMRGRISVSEKLDGSLGLMINTPDGVQITTAGGFQSPQAAHATKLYQEKYDGKWKPRKDVTYMWEIIYPENRIVVNYGDEDDIHLIGAVNIKTGKSIPISELTEWKWKKAAEFTDLKDLNSVVNSSERENHEGFVVHYLDTDARVKYKHDEYVKYHRYATGINSRRVWEAMRDTAVPPQVVEGEEPGNTMETFLMNAPEEFEGYIETTRNNLQKQYDENVNNVRSEYARFIKDVPDNISQKDFAALIKNTVHKDMQGYFFSLKNKGDFGQMQIKGFWEQIKPEHESSMWSMSNGVEE
jgi:RNA ligase